MGSQWNSEIQTATWRFNYIGEVPGKRSIKNARFPGCGTAIFLVVGQLRSMHTPIGI